MSQFYFRMSLYSNLYLLPFLLLADYLAINYTLQNTIGLLSEELLYIVLLVPFIFKTLWTLIIEKATNVWRIMLSLAYLSVIARSAWMIYLIVNFQQGYWDTEKLIILYATFSILSALITNSGINKPIYRISYILYPIYIILLWSLLWHYNRPIKNFDSYKIENTDFMTSYEIISSHKSLSGLMAKNWSLLQDKNLWKQFIFNENSIYSIETDFTGMMMVINYKLMIRDYIKTHNIKLTANQKETIFKINKENLNKAILWMWAINNKKEYPLYIESESEALKLHNLENILSWKKITEFKEDKTRINYLWIKLVNKFSLETKEIYHNVLKKVSEIEKEAY